MDDTPFPYIRDWEIWQQEPPLPLYTYNRDFPFAPSNGDSVDVLVFIFIREGSYSVEISVEARSSGPYNYVEGYTSTIEEAYALAKQVCEKYTKRFK